MKQYKTGLVIGKFLPFHKGHKYLISQALSKADNVTVIVCHMDAYSISPDLRKSWILESFPNVDVRILHHAPYLDSTSTAFSEIWARITKKFLSFTPDAVFSSEEYGKEYARCLGSAHIMVDQQRTKYCISGTKIRADPLDKINWQMLPAGVRSHYALRIAIVGAESTGTTTLARDLALHYGTVWVPEYGRFFSEGIDSFGNSHVWESDDFLHIAKIQDQMEDWLARKCNRVLVCDTNSWATSIWHLRYMGFLSEAVVKSCAQREYALYIVTAPDIPFVQDGTRDGENLRYWMHTEFVETLQREGKSYIVVSGTRENRLELAIHKIDKLLG